MNKFGRTIKNLELRTCDNHLTSHSEPTTANIVRWIPSDEGKPFCIVIAYWRKDDEGFYLHFVGSRPFDAEIDGASFWQLCVLGQKNLDEFFEQE